MYRDKIVGAAPAFPAGMEDRITASLLPPDPLPATDVAGDARIALLVPQLLPRSRFVWSGWRPVVRVGSRGSRFGERAAEGRAEHFPHGDEERGQNGA